MQTKRNKIKNMNPREVGVEIKFGDLHCCGYQSWSEDICLGDNGFLIENWPQKWLNVGHQRDSAFQGNVT
jgi:hypothetical protein